MKKRTGLPKQAKVQQVRISGSADPSMDDAEAWQQSGCGVDETVKNVGAMPNDHLIRDIDEDHVR